MPRMGVAGSSDVMLDTRVLDQILATCDTRAEDVCTRIAYLVEQDAKMNAPYDTGALSASISTTTRTSDGGGEGAAAAANPKAMAVSLPKPEAPYYAVVGPCVDYGIYQEFGTSRMAAHPYLLPAVDRAYAKFRDPSQWKGIFSGRA